MFPSRQQAILLILQLCLTRCTAELRPVINGGQSLCYPLHSEEETLKSEGLACLRLHPDDKERIDVDVFVGKKDWELEDVYVWIGSISSDTDSEIDFQDFPFVNRSLGTKEIVLKPSLQALGFSCPQTETQLSAMLKVTIRSPLEENVRDLRILQTLDDANNHKRATKNCTGVFGGL